MYVTEIVADSVQFLESKKAAAEQGGYVAQEPMGNNGYVADASAANSFDADFSSADTLDIVMTYHSNRKENTRYGIS